MLESPQSIFISDLCAEILKWINQGKHIVLAIDLNSHVVNSEDALALRNDGLIESITERHSKIGEHPTHDRGSLPIDRLFVSRSLTIRVGGYLPFFNTLLDHRPF